MFVIRDWSAPEEYNFGLNGGKKFIQNYLSTKDFHTPELIAVRSHLKSTFEGISGFLMPYPGKQTARNSSFDGRWSAIDEEFVDTMKELFPAILAPANLTLKNVNGNPVKAFELAVYIKQYVDLFKSDKLPEAKSIYESTLDNQFQILMSSSVELYLQSISMYQDRIKNESEILSLHTVAKGLALKYFNEEKKFGKEEEALVYYKELEGKLEKAYGEWSTTLKDQMEKLSKEQAKTDAQKNLVNQAERKEKEAKKKTEFADQKYLDLQRQIASIKVDNEESRREAEHVRKLLQEAEVERQRLAQSEKEARLQVQQIMLTFQQYEKQLEEKRKQAEQVMKQTIKQARERDGVSGLFGGFFNFIGNFFEKIGKAIGF
jgi:Guanylate-binding protein, N-terminal domain